MRYEMAIRYPLKQMDRGFVDLLLTEFIGFFPSFIFLVWAGQDFMVRQGGVMGIRAGGSRIEALRGVGGDEGEDEGYLCRLVN